MTSVLPTRLGLKCKAIKHNIHTLLYKFLNIIKKLLLVYTLNNIMENTSCVSLDLCPFAFTRLKPGDYGWWRIFTWILFLNILIFSSLPGCRIIEKWNAWLWVYFYFTYDLCIYFSKLFLLFISILICRFICKNAKFRIRFWL